MLSEFGYTVIEAADGEEALRKFDLQREAIQLAILDVVMPKINGNEVRDALLKLRPSLKVLFLSGYNADVLQQKGIGSSDNVMFKPLSPMDLLQVVRRILDGPAAGEQPATFVS
jgi:CheY-like chemotaxis protein